MDTAEIGTSLCIQRFRAEYFVSTEHPAPEAVKARLDEAVVKALPEMLARFLSTWLSPTDPTIWLIRKLEINLDLNVVWERDQIAKAWAFESARALTQVMQEGSDGHTVLKFPNRASYLARFLVDLADGSAWSKWYYEPFDGLRMLPLSAALRTALCDHPPTGLAALVQLDVSSRAKVVRVLTVQDAQRVLDSVSRDSPAGNENRCLWALWQVWEGTRLGSLEVREEGQNALHLYLKVCGESPDLASHALRLTALALLRLARCLAGSSVSRGKELLAALTSGNLSTLYRAVGTRHAEDMAPLMRCSTELVREVGQGLLERGHGQALLTKTETLGPRHTPFGGIFLLLPFIDALPLEQLAHDWPDADEISAVALLRFLILIKCCGRERAQQVFSDPLARDLLGIGPTLSPPAVSSWARCLKETLDSLLREVAAWQSRQGTVGYQTLLLAHAPLPGRAAVVLLDARRGVWLYAGSYQSRHLYRLADRLKPCLAPMTPGSSALIGDERFLYEMRPAFPELTIEARDSHAVRRLVEEDPRLAELLTRLERLPDDLTYLALPQSFGMPRPADLALSVVAQGVMRAFAWRLPGFAGSGLRYLYGNFLEFPGSFEEEETRHVVRLGRPPLNLILNMTGMARRTYTLSWRDERPLVLFQEG